MSNELEVHVPPQLERAYSRLLFPPSYVVVGVYRICTDKTLYAPAWEKCKNGTVRGAIVGGVWAFFTFGIQRKVIEVFYMNSPRVRGFSDELIFGYRVPFTLPTYATAMIIGSQVTAILTFFLSRNIRIARERAYDQTVASRGKGPAFWGPYVEEWDTPPQVGDHAARFTWDTVFSTFIGRLLIKNIVLAPLHFIPFLGIVISAFLRGLGTARYLHRPYFAAKKMTPHQIAVFVEERKWEYRSFGFVAAILEGLPIIGLAFTVSNRVGAAMWAHDMEKNQHYVAEQQRARHLGMGSAGSSTTAVATGSSISLPPAGLMQTKPAAVSTPQLPGGF